MSSLQEAVVFHSPQSDGAIEYQESLPDHKPEKCL